MRIAVSYENGEIFPHFGRTPAFKFYDVEDGKVTQAEVVGTNGQGHGALAGFLKNHQADVVVAGGMGAPMADMLKGLGLTLYTGQSGSADDVVSSLLAGTLVDHPEAIHAHSCHHEH